MKRTKATVCRVTGRKPTKQQYQKAAANDPPPIIPPPHKLPPYGGPCWMQAYQERLAYERLAQAQAAYLQAAYQYVTAWNATEDCLNGAPA